MARKNGAEPKEDEDRFSVYTTLAEGQEFRDFCWQTRTRFNAMALKAIRELMARTRASKHPLPRVVKLPPGPKLRPKR